MNILQTIISYLAIAAAFISSLFSWGDATMIPFENEYRIPDSIPQYSVISTEEKNDWKAKWNWDKESIGAKNVWMCLSKKVSLDKTCEKLIALISADSRYWLYINGKEVVFEGGVKRGPDKNGCYYDSTDIAPFLKKGENTISALVLY